MAGFRIANTNFDPTPKIKPVKSKDYLSFIHLLPCVVSGAREVQAAHISFANFKYGHYGRGKGQKVHDRWALPLSAVEHAKQHAMGEQDYWLTAFIDPHLLCLIIWGLFCDMGDAAEPFASSIILQNRVKP
jgi:hypothetical protein